MPTQHTHTVNKSQFSPAAVHHAARGNEGNTLFEDELTSDFAIQEKSISSFYKDGSSSDCGNGDESYNPTHLFNYLKIQPKLTVGQPGDKYEQDADRVANDVMSKSEPEIRPKPT